MAASPTRRRLATVLFIDIVGSTALATELGDARWRVVLARFRQIVRRELKRCRGREQDTAGDSFYATFAEPAQALRAAATLSAAVQDIGLDVRAGLHTGECEEIDGKLTGIAVHIGARVMALAGAAEVLATRTTRDLVVGSGAGFEEAGTHELKGVDGEWLIYRLLSIEERLPSPLEPEVAAQRLAEVLGGRARRRRWPLVAAAAVVVVLAAVAGASYWAFGRSSDGAAASLLRIDPSSGRVVSTVRDNQIGCGCGANLWVVDGTLWERGGGDGRTIAVRALASGELRRTFRLPADAAAFAIGAGAVWVARNAVLLSGPDAGERVAEVDRLDELSGRRVASIRLPGDFGNGSIAVGDGAVWALEGDATLVRIDPATNRVTDHFASGAVETQILIPAASYVWICECVVHAVLRIDPRTHATKTFHFAQQPWHLVSVDARNKRTLWLLDGVHATITQVDPRTGRAGPPLGLGGNPTEAALARGSIWVAAGKVVDRVHLASGVRTVVALPKGTHATGIAVDPSTDTVWVDNSLTEAGAA